MKKLLIAIPLVAGASWAGASYYAGAQTQSGYDQLLAQLNEFKPFTLVNDEYYAGVTQSTAITKVMDSAAADAKVLFRLHHAISHSPIGMNDGAVRVGAATIVTTLVKDDSLPEFLIEGMSDFTDAEPFQINTEVGFDGQTVNQFVVSGYERQYDDVNVMFGGIDYTSTISGDSFVGSGTVGKLVVSAADGDGELNLSEGVIQTDLTRIDQAIYTGEYGVVFDQLSFAGTSMQAGVDLKKISLVSDTKLAAGSIDSTAAFSVGEINAPIPVNSAGFDVAIKGISVAGLQSYIDFASQIPMLDAMMMSDPEIVMGMMESYKSLIGPGTSLDYAFRVSNDGGEAKVSYGVSVVDANSPNYPVNGFDSVETVRDVLNMLKLEAHLDADVAAIDQSPLAMFMGAPEAQQYIVSDGVKYTADVTVSDLIVDINGNPLSLELMVGEMLDMPLAAVLEM
ncbi:MAG: DUF945 family protein [Granulosicoccus sp.]